MKASEINMDSPEGKLLTAACYVLREHGPPQTRDKNGDEILTELQKIVDALAQG